MHNDDDSNHYVDSRDDFDSDDGDHDDNHGDDNLRGS